jgi:hypothetical protein
VVLQLELHFARYQALAFLDAGVHELFDLAAIEAHDMVVMLSFI